MTELPDPLPSLPAERALQAEIDRLNKVVDALMDRAERDMSSKASGFSLFQMTILLEDQVRGRTRELEAALRENEKFTRDLDAMRVQLAARNLALQQELALRGRMEFELQLAHDELERRVAERTADLVRANASLLREINERKQAEAEQLTTQKMLQTVIDAVPMYVFWKDRQSRYLGCNQAFARLAGTDNPHDLEGRNDYDFAWRTYAHAYQQDDAFVMHTGLSKPHIVEPLDLGNGNVRWLETSKVPLCDQQGRITGVLGVFQDVTERKNAAEALAASEREFRTLADNVPDNIMRYDCTGRVLYLNKTLERTLGCSASEVLGKRAGETAPDGRYDALEQAVRRVGASGNAEDFEQRVPGPNGETRYHVIRIVPEAGPDGSPISVLAVGRDLTAQKRAEEELRLAASVFHNSAEGVMVTDAAAHILSVNPAFSDITGYTVDEVLGRNPSLLRSDHQEPEFYQAMWESLARNGLWQGEIWNRKKGGEAYLEWLTINRIDDGAGTPIRYVAVFHDVTESRRKDEHIRHLAFHDALTGLPNRALMQDRLQHALDRARRDGGRLSVTFIDLDRFKAINDTLGHEVGDLLLIEVAHRIKKRLRAADTVARLGGDEFVVLMEELQEIGDCACLAQELIAAIAQPVDLCGYTVQVGASMGMAFFPEDGSSSMELMKRADMAMYAAKSAGRNTYRFFQPDMLERTSRQMNLEMDLRRAIDRGGLELHYQPQVALATGMPLGVEALVRWRHPTFGLLSPNDFIPLAEESGLIRELGNWVLDEACRQAAVWQADGCNIRIAVNVSARQLESGDLVERIADLTRRHGICPASLEIELTESAVMANPDKAAGLFARLRRLGVTVAVDDFGTGYSSLAYLRRLPIDVLKIDRSFVLDVDRNEEAAQIVKTILALGQALKLTVLAEGVETRRQAELLQSFGCDLAQGYLFSRPLLAVDINHLSLCAGFGHPR